LIAGSAATRSWQHSGVTVRLRPARTDECDLLGRIAVASKGHWGYDQAFLEACRPALAVFEDEVPDIVVAERDGAVAGWYRLAGEPPDGLLDDLWVRPDVIGTGLGRLLWTDAVRTARRRGLRTLLIEADPHAEGFYRAMGAERAGEVASGTIAGRTLPLMVFDVPGPHA
jgi:GNAT superfamily N-acetyltransferase